MTYIISDIHGRADRYHNLLDRIHFSDEDQLYVLGDVIDRNPDGIQILQEIIDADNILMILGNHEYMMLNVVKTIPEEWNEQWAENLGLWYLNGGEVTYQAYQTLSGEKQRQIIEYIEHLPLNRHISVIGKDYLLIHGSPEAAYSEGNTEYPDRTMYAVWNRFDPFAENTYAPQTVICGHTPTIYFTGRIPMEVVKNGNVICMDCGCAYPNGRLACLCLETGDIIYSSV